MKTRLSLSITLALGLAASSVQADRLRMEVVSGACAGCHGTDGASAGESMPTIGGLPKEYFVSVMQKFKDGRRVSTIMGRIARGYSDEEIAQMAEYFSTKPWKPQQAKLDPQLVAKGEALHDKYCANCHLADGVYAEATLPRLGGQWADYLHMQLLECKLENRPVPQPNLMELRLGKLSDEDLKALAQFYASQH